MSRNSIWSAHAREPPDAVSFYGYLPGAVFISLARIVREGKQRWSHILPLMDNEIQLIFVSTFAVRISRSTVNLLWAVSSGSGEINDVFGVVLQ